MPRLDYRCYPTSDRFDTRFGEARLREILRRSNEELVPAPLSLSLHMPADAPVSDRYCAVLAGQIRQVARLVDADRPVESIVWEANLAWCSSAAQLDSVRAALRESFAAMRPRRRYLLLSDPTLSTEPVRDLADRLGAEQVLLRIDPAGGAPAPRAIMELGRDPALRPVGVELCCMHDGAAVLPAAALIDALVMLGPDRIALRGAGAAALETPSLAPVLAGLLERIRRHGYVDLGLEELAREGSALAEAFGYGRAFYTAHGFSTRPDYDVLGFGAGALTRIGDAYAVSESDAGNFARDVALGRLPVASGVELTADDLLRRDVIHGLIRNGGVHAAALEERYGVCFERYFADELALLACGSARYWMAFDGETLALAPGARAALRPLCAVFDRGVDRRCVRAWLG